MRLRRWPYGSTTEKSQMDEGEAVALLLLKSRSAADLWRVFWKKIEDIGDEGVALKKTNGHAT